MKKQKKVLLVLAVSVVVSVVFAQVLPAVDSINLSLLRYVGKFFVGVRESADSTKARILGKADIYEIQDNGTKTLLYVLPEEYYRTTHLLEEQYSRQVISPAALEFLQQQGVVVDSTKSPINPK